MAAAVLITSEEFLTRPDTFDASGNPIREELINGEIVPMGFRSKRHDLVKSNAAITIGVFLKAHPDLALLALSETTFRVNEMDTFTPDVSVIRRDRFEQEGRLLEGAPEIAIEVVSPTDTAQGLRKKIKTYLENGSLAVWIFYDDGSVLVHTRAGVRELSGDQALEDSLLPGFSAPVSSFFAV